MTDSVGEHFDDWWRRQAGVPTRAEANEAQRAAAERAAEDAERFREAGQLGEEARARELGLPDPRVPVEPQSPDHELRARLLLNDWRADGTPGDLQAALRATDPRVHAPEPGTGFDGGARGVVGDLGRPVSFDDAIRARAERNFENRND